MKFTLKLLIRHTVETGEVFIEESLVMLDAASFDDAYDMAGRYIEKSGIATTYKNVYGMAVKSEVLSTADCFSVYEDEEEVEVYSNFIKCGGVMTEETIMSVMEGYCSREDLLPLREFPEPDKTDADED